MKGMEGERYRQTVQKKERCGEKQGELKEEKAGREKKDSDWKGGESEAETAAADAGGRGADWALPLWGLNLIAMYTSSKLQWSTRIPDNIS